MLKATEKKVPQALIGLVAANSKHESSFVRKAAIKFLSKLWKLQPNFSPGFCDKIEDIFRNETEAIVRRELALFVFVCLDPNQEKTVKFMILASKDFDWEVRNVAFKFWSTCFEKKLEQHINFEGLTTDLKENGILEGLELLAKDNEKDLQKELYKWLCAINVTMSTKYPLETRVNNDVFFTKDFSGNLKQVEEFNEYHYGLNSVLDDIIQLEENECVIDAIDCI